MVTSLIKNINEFLTLPKFPQQADLDPQQDMDPPSNQGCIINFFSSLTEIAGFVYYS
jgi:hypothetical protein